MIAFANGLTSGRAQSLTPVNGTHRTAPRQTTGMRHWGEYSEAWFQQDNLYCSITNQYMFMFLNACIQPALQIARQIASPMARALPK